MSTDSTSTNRDNGGGPSSGESVVSAVSVVSAASEHNARICSRLGRVSMAPKTLRQVIQLTPGLLWGMTYSLRWEADDLLVGPGPLYPW